MNEEEKKAIAYLKFYIERDVMYEDTHYEQIKTILNLIEKQSKEIEELKENNKQKYYHVVKSNELEEEINNAWENKIKAKIEELDEEIKVKREIAKNPMDRVSGRLLPDSIVELEKTKKVLQSLLEKE